MPTLQTAIPIAIIALTSVVLLVRRLWLMAELERYGLNALYFCQRNKLPVHVADEMSQIWPTFHILFEVWHWDFSRYVVHQDHLETMNVFIAAELTRKDLDLARWEVENGVIGEDPSSPTPKPIDKPSDQSQPPAPPTS